MAKMLNRNPDGHKVWCGCDRHYIVNPKGRAKENKDWRRELTRE